MKKLLIIIISIFSLFVFNMNAHASTKYVQGIVRSTSSLYTKPEASTSTRMKSDTGSAMTLYYPEAVEIVGESGNYYQIKFIYSGFFYTGYIAKSNVIRHEYTSDDDYERSLIDKGFPSDYASKLAILHAIHPNWSFVPSYTGKVSGGLDFYSAVDKEAEVVSRNLVSSSNTTLRSTADGAYSNGEWISLSGKGWYAASKQTIAFYLDPRNFFNESNIFMFENLGFNESSQTPEVVTKVLSSTFMRSSYTCFDNAYLCTLGSHSFVDTFMVSGRDKSVSPVHLATRVKQEQGSDGSVLSLGKGYNGDYVGYYNFFNISASGKTDDEVIKNGLKYAKDRNWNNQYASIYEGSSMIGSYYIKVGQSTLYYQKFNTINQNYDHQYQQNVKAPYSEGYSTYESYYKSYSSQEEWNNAYYDFLIPVYKNMGAYTTLDTSGNADATLKSLTISSCSMNPSFQSSAYEYDCYVPLDTKSVSVSAATTNSLATVDYPSEVSLSELNTEVNITVTAAAKNTATYKVTVHRIETDGYSPKDVLNGIGIKVSGDTLSNFEVGTDVSNIVNNIKNKFFFASVKITDANNKEYSGDIKTGLNISVTNAGSTSNFKVTVYGDTSGDGSIDIRDLLVVQKHLVKAKTLDSAYLTAADINKDGQVDIRDLLLVQKYILNQYSISQ